MRRPLRHVGARRPRRSSERFSKTSRAVIDAHPAFLDRGVGARVLLGTTMPSSLSQRPTAAGRVWVHRLAKLHVVQPRLDSLAAVSCCDLESRRSSATLAYPGFGRPSAVGDHGCCIDIRWPTLLLKRQEVVTTEARWRPGSRSSGLNCSKCLEQQTTSYPR